MRWAAALILAATGASAHDGVQHKSVEEARQHAAQTSEAPVGPDTVFPVDLGGAFTLTDHAGAQRTEADPDGHMQLVFFGYANCPSICAVAMPAMAETVNLLAGEGIPTTPVMITVDPDRDRVGTMAEPLQGLHPNFVGLTGTEGELQKVYDLFSVEKKVVFEDPEHGPIFAHGSFVYLLDGQGTFMTLLPPVLSVERMAEIVASYAVGS